MFNLNRLSGLDPHQKARHFSTYPSRKPLLNNMPTSTGFLHNIDLQNISSQKRFVNPNFVNKNMPNAPTCPSNLNIHPNNVQLRDICSGFSVATKGNNIKPQSFSTDHTVIKEDTHRKKEPYMKIRNHSHSPKKTQKSKMKIDIKYEIDEIGVDVLSDQFESDSNDNTPTMDRGIAPVFIHEAMQDIQINTETCKISSSPICIAIGTPEAMPTMLLSITENITRRRMPSECSEDSFIVFQCGTEEDDDISDFESDTETEDEESDSACSDDEECMVKTDDDILKDSMKVTKKVTFAKNLCTIHPIVAWSYAYKCARKGHWEEYARDRGRFKDRILRTEKILSPILLPDHRKMVYNERYQVNSQ